MTKVRVTLEVVGAELSDNGLESRTTIVRESNDLEVAVEMAAVADMFLSQWPGKDRNEFIDTFRRGVER